MRIARGLSTAVAFLLLLGACATPIATSVESQDRVRDQRRARIYFLWPAAIPPVVLPVTVDGQTIGAVAPASYLFVDRAPGPHTVGIEGKGIFGTSKFEANIQTTAGGAYYYLLAVDDRPPGTGPGYSMLLRIASANAGERLEGRGNSGMRLYSLDADVGAAEIAKLRPARMH